MFTVYLTVFCVHGQVPVSAVYLTVFCVHGVSDSVPDRILCSRSVAQYVHGKPCSDSVPVSDSVPDRILCSR